jgi:gliding motility-associated-like protein
MKQLFSFALALLPVFIFAQITCVVTPADTTICFRDSMAFVTVVSAQGNITYRWQKEGIDIPGATNDTLAFPKVLEGDTGTYRCIATRGADTDTSNDARLQMYPRMFIDTLYRYNELGCPGDCKGQFKVKVSGGLPPYAYSWGAGYSQDTIVFGLCFGTYTLSVTDMLGCVLDTSYFVDVLKSPKVTFTRYTKDVEVEVDTIYMQNPTINVKFPDEYRDSIISWSWNFGDGAIISQMNPASHTYISTGKFEIRLIFTDLNNCNDSVRKDSLIVMYAHLKIPLLFTPNGDGYNDKFMIRVLPSEDLTGTNYGSMEFHDAYLGNELVVYDRWGKRVFAATNYKSGDWDGRNLSDGVYFYVLKCTTPYGDEVSKGSVTILRGN